MDLPQLAVEKADPSPVVVDPASGHGEGTRSPAVARGEAPARDAVDAASGQASLPSATSAVVRGSAEAFQPGLADRVEHVRALQESAQAGPPRMRVDLGDVDGSGTRVRLDLRGGKVGARIEVTDPTLGDSLERRVGSLKTALESRGLEPDGIQVRTIVEEASAAKGVLKGVESAAATESEFKETRDRSRDGSGDRKDLPEERRQDGPGRQKREEEDNHDR